MSEFQLHCGDALSVLTTLPDASVDCCVTSPPYFGLRDYGTGQWEGGDAKCEHSVQRWEGAKQTQGAQSGHSSKHDILSRKECHCGALRVDRQLGLERTPEEYVARLVEVFREVRRVLKPQACLWLNLGDSYCSQGGPQVAQTKWQISGASDGQNGGKTRAPVDGLKPKDLIGIPWMCAFALRLDGWWLRSEVIWCLSGGTWLYARTKKGDMPIMVRDAARLNPSSVKLWNGDRWTQVLGWSRSARTGSELEIVLRGGERISCTPTHKFPSNRGILSATELRIGDKLIAVALPEPESPKRPDHIGNDAAWLAGLYLAEGSRSDDTIQLAGHAEEVDRFSKVARIAKAYGGSATVSISGRTQNIRVYGRLLVALIDELISGRIASDKCISSLCWRYDNPFLRALLDGYLSGDGHWDAGNKRWRLGFTRNYNLERDLRVLAARLGFRLRLRPSTTTAFGRRWPIFCGEIRFESNRGHHNEKDSCEIVGIRKARCRYVYDIGVADEPHLFALASGVLTHNSKPNPMPESVTDRPTKSHEQVFLLSKSERYLYQADAVREPLAEATLQRDKSPRGRSQDGGGSAKSLRGYEYTPDLGNMQSNPLGKNRRSVWTIASESFPEGHFAVMPEALVEPCILAGCPESGTILDPFCGSGTVGAVALLHKRNFIGIDLNPDYIQMARRRLYQASSPLLGDVEVSVAG